MMRLITFIVVVAIIGGAGAWLADRPGEVAVTWMGNRIEFSVMVAVVAIAALAVLAVIVWSLLRLLVGAPNRVSRALRDRRQRRGQRAVGKGLLAVASGDLRTARRAADDAGRLAKSNPLTLLLTAQTAQLAGDRAGADAAFRAMTEHGETRLLGLRGLFIEAQRRNDVAAARQYAEQAAQSAPSLAWAGDAALSFRAAEGDWTGALGALETNFHAGLLDREAYARQRAVLLTARAQELENTDPTAARNLVLEAVKLAPDLVPAAALAGKLLAESRDLRRAARLLQNAWRRNPHPDIADVYAHLRFGDSSHDRLARVQTLVRSRANHPEGALALARAALDAGEYPVARKALEPLLNDPTQRVCLLMAELEQAEHGAAARAREWIARALRANRDPCWTADGYVSQEWLPVSPVTGRIDAFEWKVPVAEIGQGGNTVEADRMARPAVHPALPSMTEPEEEEPPLGSDAERDAPAMPSEAAAREPTMREAPAGEPLAPALATAEPSEPTISPAAAAPAGAAPVVLPAEALTPAAPVPPSPASPAAAAADPAAPAATPEPVPERTGGNAGAATAPWRTRNEPLPPSIRAPDDPGPEPDRAVTAGGAERQGARQGVAPLS